MHTVTGHMRSSSPAARTLPGLVAAAHQAALGANCIATPFMLRPPAHTTVNTSTP